MSDKFYSVEFCECIIFKINFIYFSNQMCFCLIYDYTWWKRPKWAATCIELSNLLFFVNIVFDLILNLEIRRNRIYQFICICSILNSSEYRYPLFVWTLNSDNHHVLMVDVQKILNFLNLKVMIMLWRVPSESLGSKKRFKHLSTWWLPKFEVDEKNWYG